MITARACAKIILVGEHAVVYGQPAIAIPVSGLQITVTAQLQPKGQRGLSIGTQDGSIVHTPDTNPDSPLIQMAQSVLRELKVDPPNLNITIKSQIPIASGLGSGAAISTALGRVLYQWYGVPADSTRLNQLVYEIEKIYHGTPSGIDNSVIVYEQPVYFVREQPIDHLAIQYPFTLLIGNSGKMALTHESVGDVRKLYESDSNRVTPLLDAIGALVQHARHAIEIGNVGKLGQLMTENHTLLQKLTVSSPELDHLVEAAMDAGALGAKLSGGGRGGNMIALVDANTQESVQSALLGAGAVQVYQTHVVEKPV